MGLSLAGGRAGFAGAQSGTVWHFVRLLRGLGDDRPEVIVLVENVTGLAPSHGGDDLTAAIRVFNELGTPSPRRWRFPSRVEAGFATAARTLQQRHRTLAADTRTYPVASSEHRSEESGAVGQESSTAVAPCVTRHTSMTRVSI
ncbi:hypothetical protein [Rhodococcoides kroppenstedtii]|uniref:hypothetical protein n=1 Tax=Rhodococcoides kroppenstedtii TaxID=293050 RepID=UPI00352FF1FA